MMSRHSPSILYAPKKPSLFISEFLVFRATVVLYDLTMSQFNPQLSRKNGRNCVKVTKSAKNRPKMSVPPFFEYWTSCDRKYACGCQYLCVCDKYANQIGRSKEIDDAGFGKIVQAQDDFRLAVLVVQKLIPPVPRCSLQ